MLPPPSNHAKRFVLVIYHMPIFSTSSAGCTVLGNGLNYVVVSFLPLSQAYVVVCRCQMKDSQPVCLGKKKTLVSALETNFVLFYP